VRLFGLVKRWFKEGFQFEVGVDRGFLICYTSKQFKETAKKDL